MTSLFEGEPIPGQGDLDQVESDAAYVWALATSLGDDASEARTSAVVSMVLDHFDADPIRLERLAHLCRSRHRTGEDDGFPEAELLIQRAIRIIVAAGADVDPEARAGLRRELNSHWRPEPEAYEWDRERRRRLRWWLRWLAARRVRLRLQAAQAPAAIQRVAIELGRRSVGKLLYQVCDECRLVVVGKIELAPEYQGLGLGRRAILEAHIRYPTYAWHTTAQYPTSGTFWSHMATRTGAAFTKRSQCSHMMRDLASR